NSDYVPGRGWRHRGVYYKDGYDFGLQPNHFTFVAMNHFSSREVAKHQLKTPEQRQIYAHATVINGTMNQKDGVYVNHGVAVEQVRAATHTQIQKMSIRNSATSEGASDKSRAAGSAPAVFRHPLPAPSQSGNVVAQRVTDQSPAVLHRVTPPTGTPTRGQPPPASPAQSSIPHGRPVNASGSQPRPTGLRPQ